MPIAATPMPAQWRRPIRSCPSTDDEIAANAGIDASTREIVVAVVYVVAYMNPSWLITIPISAEPTTSGRSRRSIRTDPSVRFTNASSTITPSQLRHTE